MTTRKTLAPVILLVTVTLATFGLATWHPFTPDTAPAAEAEGDVDTRRDRLLGELLGLSRD